LVNALAVEGDGAVGIGDVQVEALRDTACTRDATVRDPQGATLVLSEYRPPGQG
jgi:hypothetical protein